MSKPDPIHETIVAILRKRCGLKTKVVLSDGTELLVYNIAWGTDEGDDRAHITTNISPKVEGSDIDYFLTDDVIRLEAADTDQPIWSQGR